MIEPIFQQKLRRPRSFLCAATSKLRRKHRGLILPQTAHEQKKGQQKNSPQSVARSTDHLNTMETLKRLVKTSGRAAERERIRESRLGREGAGLTDCNGESFNRGPENRRSFDPRILCNFGLRRSYVQTYSSTQRCRRSLWFGPSFLSAICQASRSRPAV
jgi:hypothetical protein